MTSNETTGDEEDLPDNWRTLLIAKAVAYAIQGGKRRTVFCEGCKTAFLSGPTHCAKCGRVVTEDEIMKHIEDSLADETTAENMKASVPATPQFAPRIPGRRGPPEKLHEHAGEKLTLSEWSARSGISKDTLRIRLGYGWTMTRALAEPVHEKKIMRISHPDYVPAIQTPIPEANSEVEIAVVPTSVLEARLKLADDVDSIKPEIVGEVPAAVKLIRERCQRLDEIDYEISLLRMEKQKIVDELVKERSQ